ncbi:50S ribosomal protein L4 [Cohaesibacter celericrescens]|jgi:large subunit ribosomal protein L4|uniref:Large ribosomal subunit protein uL4 n=1 Tax=Cohaesibacter celericrescens TaxID=2067669 RepID=A0A2N5XVK5_9HYPH|nr:50S ribosomal protein L4 [Cohaesibacter celericrescens]PLW78507.1 50S ribosomal protein L4 [Cohaesibacter celericrescens]
MELQVKTLDGKEAGSVAVSDSVFGLEPRADIIARMVRYQQMKKMAGTHKTKTRAEITGTTKKYLRQKGSGGARHGNKKVPQFRGGGRAFGPVVRDHSIELPKKVRALALKHALSSKLKNDSLIILDDVKSDVAKTAAVKKQISGLGIVNALIISGKDVDENFAKAARNIVGIDVLPVQGINVLDVLRRDTLVLTKAAIDALEERFK